MKITVLDANTLGNDIDLTRLASAGELSVYDYTAPDEIPQRISDSDVLVLNKVKLNESNLCYAKNLKLICITATGYDNIDVKYCKSRDIQVSNIVGYSTNSVAQVTIATVLELATHIREFNHYVTSGDYTKMGVANKVTPVFNEITGKTWGIIGLGNIGKKVAYIAEAFGMDVCYFSTSGTGHCKDYPCLSLGELLAKSDIVSIHASLNDRTLNLIGAEQLAMMKPTAYLVNMGRGAIVVEADLAKAVDEGVIAGAGIDVFVTEPIPEDHPYLTMKHPERMCLAPHVAWASMEARKRLVGIMAENIAKGW